MTVTDQVVGTVFVVAAIVVFVYYTAWVAVSPLLDARHPIQAFFPERKYALLIPALGLAGAVSVAGLFIASTLLAAGKKSAAPAAAAPTNAAVVAKGKKTKSK